MGLREAIVTTVILGLTTAAGAADGKKPAKAEPAKTAKKSADLLTAERPDPAEADAGAAGSAAPAEQMPAHLVGPKHVELGNNTSIDLPAGMIMFERAVAQDLLRKNDEPSERVVGIVFKPDSTWHVSLEYADSGYIEDSDADDLDAGELLDSYRKGTEEQNKIRKSHGNAELFIDGWSEPPRYEHGSHHLVWGLAAHSADGKVVNFFTRILGRTGFLSLNLIDTPEHLEASKKEALALLQGTRFSPGSAYTDHVSSDRSSGIGLRGLVLGGAGVAVASKLGLFGLLLKLLIAFKKVVILGGIAIAAVARRLFRRRSAASAAVASQGPPGLSVPQAPLEVAPRLDAQQPPAAPPPGWPPPRDPSDGSSSG